LHDIGNLDLEEDGTIRGCKLAYATFGKINAAGDNAILIPTWYSATSKIMEPVSRAVWRRSRRAHPARRASDRAAGGKSMTVRGRSIQA
jgi:hypothetical protein